MPHTAGTGGKLRRAGVAIAAALAGLAALGAPLPARAAAPRVVAVSAGWDGQAVQGAWAPVRVRLRGGDQDLHVTVEALLQNEWQFPTGTHRYPVAGYGREEALPAGVEKDIVLWVPMTGPVGAEVRVLDGDRVLASRQVTFQFGRGPGWPLVGVLASDRAVGAAIEQVRVPFQGLPVPIGAARVSPAEIPSSGDKLDALDALVVQGDVAATLSDSQRGALKAWVEGGGELVLVGGPQAAQALRALPDGVLPLQLAGTETVQRLAPLGAWSGGDEPPAQAAPVSVLRPRGGVVLAGPTDRPLVWRAPLGRGGVTVLAADPSLAPLRTWSHLPSFWKKVLEPALPGTDNPDVIPPRRAAWMQNVLGLVDSFPPGAFPDWSTVALILGGFAVVAGPVLHGVLGRLDRREWTWLAVPALAALVAAGLYGAGFVWQRRDVIRNVVSRVQLGPGTATQTLALGVFAPTRQEIELRLPGDVPVQVSGGGPQGPVGPFGPVGPGSFPTDPPYRVLTGRDTRVRFNGGEWGMRAVQFERPLGPEVGRIEANLRLDGGAIAGTVKNATPYHLEDAFVVLGAAFERVGDLAPGQEARVRLGESKGVDPFRGGPGLGWRLYARPKNPPPQPPAPGIVLDVWQLYDPPPPDPEIQQRIRMLDMLLQRPSPGPGPSPLPLTVFAFTRDPVGAVEFEPAGHPTYYLSLLEQPLRLDLAPGPFRLPGALVVSEVVGMTSRGWGTSSNGQVTWVEIEGGSLDFAFRPPLPAGARVDALVIGTRQVNLQNLTPPVGKPLPLAGGPPGSQPAPGPRVAPAAPGVFSLYNWQTGTWDALPAGREEARVSPAAAYVGPDHEVRLRASAVQGRLAFVVPEVSFEGRMGS